MISEVHITAEKISQKGKAKYLYNQEELFVEQVAQKYYEEQGFKTIWSENDYWWTIVTLLFWEIIYAKIDGAWEPRFGDEFPSTIQDMPHDFFKPEFYQNRERIIDNRIKELNHTNLISKLKKAYKTHYGTPARLIENWDKFSSDDLVAPLESLPQKAVVQILKRFISDINYNRAGFPDLMVFNDSDFMFVEVKGEKDKISEKQEEWMSFMSKELELKVIIFGVNQGAKKIKTITKKKPDNEVKISFGKSSSKKREEAIAFIESLPTFKKEEKDDDTIYSATFIIKDDIENIYKLLDFTSGWKTQEILVNGTKVSSGDIRGSLWCFRRKEEQQASMDYCRTDEYSGKRNKYGCQSFSFHGLDHDSWEELGYIDTEKEIWVFDKEELKKSFEQRLKSFSLCPHFDPSKAQKLFDALPDTINPKVDLEWAFFDDNRYLWFWDNGTWKAEYGREKFPGIARMIGVQKLGKDDRKKAKEYEEMSKDWDFEEDDEGNVEITMNIDPVSREAKPAKKPFYKRWWFILLMILFFLSIVF